MPKKKIKYIDLFCGLGAFHYAFNKNNKDNKTVYYKCVFSCDIDENVRNIYQENYNIKPEGDINKVNISKLPDFDILCAGFPCQSFSIAGKQEGFKDKIKGNLFYKILDIIDIKTPDTLILENVKNLETHDKGKTFDIIKKEIEKRNYIFNYKIIDSKYYNSPQSRKRIFIICNKKKKYNFKEIKNDIVSVSSILDNSITTYFEYEEKYKLEKCINKNSMMIYKLINKKTGKGGRQGERIYNIEKCGPTICASSGGPGSNTGLYEIHKKIRTLSVKETFKMFGFNDDYKYTTLKNEKKMLFYLGNSIVVNVVEQIIKDLDI
jgi:DNA (cytosine-5)-methyltransferase 1